MQSKLEQLEKKIDSLTRSPAFLLFAGGVALLIFSGWLWWAKVYTSPRAVFSGMLAHNLSVSSVQNHHVSAERNGLKIDKTSQLAFGTANTIKISAATTATASKTTVKTETIATPKQEFNRYTNISTSQKNASGQVPDFKNILGKWAKSDTSSTAFVQSVLQPYALPQASLSPEARSLLLDYLKENTVFDTNYKVVKSTVGGRPMYTYDVNIQPVAYISFIKAFATRLGFTDLDQVDPRQAQGSPAVPAKVTVDVRAHRLYKIDYPSLGYNETFTAYNQVPAASMPKATVSSQQLQQLVSQLQ